MAVHGAEPINPIRILRSEYVRYTVQITQYLICVLVCIHVYIHAYIWLSLPTKRLGQDLPSFGGHPPHLQAFGREIHKTTGSPKES